MKKVLSLIVAILMFVPIPIHGAKKATSIENYSEGKEVKGDCLGKEVVLSDDLKGMMVANSEGLQFIDNEEFVINTDHPVKRFEVVDDLDGDGIKDVAVFLKVNSGYSNFQIISSRESKIIYEKTLTHQTVDENANIITENSIIRQIIGNEKIVYLIYDHHILAIDPNKKDIIFDYEDEDNIWKMVIVDDKLIFTTQQGQIISLDKKTGKKNYSKLITTTIEAEVKYRNRGSGKEAVRMNLWDIIVVNDLLYVSSEGDKLYQINIDNGDIINELDLGVVDQEDISKRLSEQTMYDRGQEKYAIFTTGVFSQAFNGYKMKMIKDELMLVEAYLGDQDYYFYNETETSNKGIEPTLLIIDTIKSEVRASIKLDQYNLHSSNAVFTTYQGQEVLVIPSNVNKGVLRIAIYSLEGKLIAQNDLKNLGVDQETVKVSLSAYQDKYLLQINGGNSYILNNDLKSVSSLGSSKIISMIADLDEGILVSSNQNGKINELIKFGLNGKDDILMQSSVPNSYLNSGFEAISYDRDHNQILTLVNELNNQNEVVASHIIIIDGSTGKIIIDKKVLIDTGIDKNYLIGNEINYFADLNNDGKKEILVDNSIIDGNDFTFKANYEQQVDDNGVVIDVGDLNNDGISDLVSVGETEMRVYNSSRNGFEINYQKSNIVKKYDKNLLNNQHVKVLGDLDNNGINQFVINARNSTGCQYYQVINPLDLSVRFDLMADGVYDWGEAFIFMKVDYNHDGVSDLIYNGPENIQQVISGKDGSVIVDIKKNSDDYDRDVSSPAPLDNIIPINLTDDGDVVYQLEDLNDDGIKELGYLFFNYNDDNDYVKLRILDGKSFDELKLITLDNFILENIAIVPVQGQTKVLAKGVDYNQIYDYQDEVLVAGCSIEANKARVLKDGRILIENNSGELYAFDDQVDFELVGFDKDKYSSGDITIKYQSDKSGMISVYDHGVLIGSSTDQEVDIKLLQGKHRLVFSYDDGQGKVTHITRQIEVSKSSLIKYLIILLSLIIVLAGGLIVVYPKYRLEKEAGVKHAKNN